MVFPANHNSITCEFFKRNFFHPSLTFFTISKKSVKKYKLSSLHSKKCPAFFKIMALLNSPSISFDASQLFGSYLDMLPINIKFLQNKRFIIRFSCRCHVKITESIFLFDKQYMYIDIDFLIFFVRYNLIFFLITYMTPMVYMAFCYVKMGKHIKIINI